MEAPGIETEQFLERKDEGGQWAPLSLHQVIHNNIYQNRQFNSEVGLALNAWGGFLLGIGLTTSVLMFVFVPYLRHFMGYLFFLSVFHILEYAMTALFRPAELRWSSFIINHSKAYNYALLASFLEYWIEYLLLPSMKMQMLSIFTGFVLMAGGQLLRSAAMWHCAGNFSHIIAERKNDDHTLVTGGVYQISRHPSYLGWFWWSVGTQVFLGNPLCVCAYAYASWKFFDSRIRYEERRLFTFFGDTYADFHDKVGIHIPFIKTKNLLRPDRPLN